MKTMYEEAVDYAKKHYFINPVDLKMHGIHRQYIGYLERDGYVEKYSRGVYVSKLFSEEPSFATFSLACKQISSGVICLLSALEYHDITTQLPEKIWICVNYNFVEPRGFPYPLAIVKTSEKMKSLGVIESKVGGGVIRVFNAAKTVVDCFKYRNKIGIDIAIEALKEGLEKKKFSIEEFYKYATLCRVSKIMKPYLEAVMS